ncbi:MAG TPA: hypothetical protein GXX15_04055 [Clostridia bacterium]|nr:hypothetical protein [Clostridia bacterium]
MYIGETFNFENIPEKLNDIVRNLNKDNFKKFRWFQEKAYDILDLFLFDYGILSKKEYEFIIAAIIAFVVKAPTSKKEITLLYYVPLIITPYFRNNDLIDIIESPNLKAFIYDGIDDIDYVRFLNKVLSEETAIKFDSGAQLIPYNLKKDDIYSSRRLSNKSSNSLTFLKKDEIVKTYRKFVKGINPDLEMTLELKNAGFRNVQDIRGYFLYEDSNGDKYTVAIIVEHIKNMGDMWQYTQEYILSMIISILSDYEEFEEGYVEDYCNDYIEEIKEIARIIANMHIKLSSIDKEGFMKKDVEVSDVQEVVNSIKNNFVKLLDFIKLSTFEEKIASMIENIQKQREFLMGKLEEFENTAVFGKYIRCHGDLHLEQILKSEEGYVLIDFEGEPTKPIEMRRKKMSPLKDIAGMMRSFSYAAYAAYFNYLDTKGKSKEEKVEKILSAWEKLVTETFVENYLEVVMKKAPDIIPEGGNFDKVLAIFKLDKALFEGIYEVNNRPSWFKIPLKGILGCIEDLKLEKHGSEVNYG